MKGPFNKISRLPPYRARRGGAYILVLGVALLVTVIGMGALLTSRLGARQAATASDWEEAGLLAQAAVEDAISNLNGRITASPSTWRNSLTSYVAASGSYAFTQSIGRGTMAWAVKDELDGNFSNNYQDPFRLYGIGKVGQATRVYSVQVVPGGTALDVLRCGAHAAGNVTNNGVVCLGAGPLSSNAAINALATVWGSIECATHSGAPSNIKGSTNVGMPAKTMPSAGIYNVYLAKATAMSWTSFNAGSSAGACITPTNNPFGSTNPEGIYSLAIPTGQSATMCNMRIKGTMVISMTGGTLNISGPIQWDPTRADYPILIINASNATINITGSTIWLSESTFAIDFNGNGTTTDDLPPQLHGLIHVIGSTNTVNPSGNAYIHGLLLTDGTITTAASQTTFVSDPNLVTCPPMGYGQGDQLLIVPGSWVWDAVP